MRGLTICIGIMAIIISVVVNAGEKCDSLIEVNGELWIVDQFGEQTQLTNNAPSPRKYAVIWAPDGMYVAYAPSPKGGNNKEKSIIISDKQGKQISKILVEPEQEVETVRFVDKIVWWKPNILISEGVAGRYGVSLDIFELSHDLTQNKHLKRIITYYCDEYVLSEDLKSVACINRAEKAGNYLEIYDATRSYDDPSNTWESKQPKRIDLGKIQLDYPCRMEYSPAKENVLLTTKDGQYEVNLKTEYVRDLKISPEKVISQKPEYIKIKVKGEKKAKEYDVLDAFCYDQKQE